MIDFGDKLLRKWREAQLISAARGILDTPTVKAADDGVVLFSMIGTKVLLPYLVAVKSIHQYLGCGRIVILDDGTLTEEDRQILRDQLDAPQIFDSRAVDTKACPTYSSWKRLFTLLELRRDNYVIQLDSDTVTVGDVALVRQCVARGENFILRGEAEAEFTTPAVIAEAARSSPYAEWENAHVQLAMEAKLDKVVIAGRDNLRHVRGCAGFAGFAPDPGGTELAEEFSAEATRLIGFEKWSEWGSEQVTSNFLISNAHGSHLLPYDHYFNYWNEPYGSDMRFVHFIGTYRYNGGAYRDACLRAISMLNGVDDEPRRAVSAR